MTELKILKFLSNVGLVGMHAKSHKFSGVYITQSGMWIIVITAMLKRNIQRQ